MPKTHDQPHDDDVTRVFASMKPRERALLWLAYVEGEDHQSIAAALGLARGSIKVLLSRARARLRDLIESMFAGGLMAAGVLIIWSLPSLIRFLSQFSN